MSASNGFPIQLMSYEDIEPTLALIRSVFDVQVAPGYTPAGCKEFYHFANTEALLTRLSANHATFIALESDQIIGVVEIRPPNHISLLFVDCDQQRKGIGKALFEQARTWIVKRNPETRYISVNASPNAQQAYAHWGFEATHREKEHNGILYIPMLYPISQQGDL